MIPNPRIAPRFPLGAITATPAALDLLGGDTDLASLLIMRHAAGDGGDIDSHDAGLNAEAIRLGGARILSAYKLVGAGTVWIITEADRSVTTLLTPGDY